jgi:hypothetical protein
VITKTKQLNYLHCRVGDPLDGFLTVVRDMLLKNFAQSIERPFNVLAQAVHSAEIIVTLVQQQLFKFCLKDGQMLAN